MNRPHKTKGRILYLLETIAINLLGGTSWILVEDLPEITIIWTIIAAAYYTFWIAKPRLMDISKDQEALQQDISGKNLGLWGGVLWGYFLIISALLIYSSLSLNEKNAEHALFATSGLALLTLAYAPVHLYLLFKPGYKSTESADVLSNSSQSFDPWKEIGGSIYPDLKNHHDNKKIETSQDAQGPSIERSLLLLNDLYYKGLISADELENKRSEIIQRI